MKNIEKYVGLYLLVYVAVIAICGFFEYMANCQGQSLQCAFDKDGFNTIITTTAYVLTPIIAIIALESWRSKHNRSLLSNEAKDIYQKLFDIKDYFDVLNKLSLIFNFSNDREILIKEIIEHLDSLQSKISIISEKIKFITDLTEDDELTKLYCDHQIKYHSTHQMIKRNFDLKQSDGLTINNYIDDLEVIINLNYRLRKSLKTYILV